MRGRVCVGIRTHRYGPAEERLLGRVEAQLGPGAVYLVVDETRQMVDVPAGVNKVSLDRKYLESEGLYADAPKVGWLCGDYALYALRQRVAADQYWLIEPDVFFGDTALAALFDAAGRNDADLLAAEFAKAKPGWAWYRHGQQVAHEVYRCLFSLIRVSGAAIDQLREARRRLSAEVATRPPLKRFWPNDESFVATVLGNSSLRGADLLRLPGLDFTGFHSSHPIPLSRAQQAAPHAVMHPVLDRESFERKVRQVVESAVARSDLDPLTRHLSAVCSGDDRAQVESIAIATVSEWLTRRLREPLPPTGEAAAGAAGLPPGPVAFAALPAGMTVGAKAVKAVDDPALGAINDFELALESTQAVQPTAGRRFAPYQVDAATRSMLFIDAPRQALTEPLLSQALRRFGRLAQRVPLDTCVPGEPDDCRSTFVFSIGHCGESLFSRIAGLAGHAAVAGCDVFTGIPRLASEADRQRALACAVEAVRAFCHVPSEKLVFELRSQSSPMAALTRRVFPQARYFMLLRELEPWSRSVIRTLDWKPEQLSTTLLGAIHAMAAFRKAGGTMQVVAYEQFARRPEAIWDLFNPGSPPTPVQLAKLRQSAAAEARDGAAGSPAAKDVDRRVAAFLAHWDKVRPAEQIRALGLTL